MAASRPYRRANARAVARPTPADAPVMTIVMATFLSDR
jgi:hypothetical protein